MTAKGKLARIQRAEERAKKLRLQREKESKTIEFLWHKGYPISNVKCHCGSKTYISGRGMLKGWSGIECCGCGNLIENCACRGLLPSQETVKSIVDKIRSV